MVTTRSQTRSTAGATASLNVSPNSWTPGSTSTANRSGSAANWYARQLRFRGAMRGSLSGNLATMGPGVPYAIGAKFGHPGRPVKAKVTS